MEYKKFAPDSTVELFKVVVTKEGNIKYPGIYGRANPLPEKFMTSQYVTLVDGSEIKEDKGYQDSDFEIKNLNPPTAKIEETIIKPQHSKESPKDYININTVDVETLIDLDGIGKGTAKKVTQLRELSPFSNYSDLNDRVPLAFGRDWKDFNLTFGETDDSI